MSDKSITLHIGAGKCGSSALQTALSASPTIQRNDGSVINYARLDRQNNIIIDKERLTAMRGVNGYTVSSNVKDMMSLDFEKVKDSIAQYPTDLLFSSEGWFNHPAAWETLLEKLDLTVKIVAYVRPQVPVLNSAWWQWGAWSDEAFDDWMEKHINACLWGRRVQSWSKLERVSSLTVRPVPADIVTDFYENVLAAPKPIDLNRSNPSLPGPVLRLFQRNRVLRPSMHKSGIDFALSRVIKMRDASIWVLDESHIAYILEKTAKDNELLLSYMDEASGQSVRADPRWWSAAAYEDKVAEPPTAQPIPPKKLEEMCVKMAQAIYEMQLVEQRKRRARAIRLSPGEFFRELSRRLNSKK